MKNQFEFLNQLVHILFQSTITVIYTHITNVMKESVIDSLDTVSLNGK